MSTHEVFLYQRNVKFKIKLRSHFKILCQYRHSQSSLYTSFRKCQFGNLKFLIKNKTFEFYWKFETLSSENQKYILNLTIVLQGIMTLCIYLLRKKI